MWRRLWKPLVVVLPWTAIVLAVLYIIYQLVDPLPPRRFGIAAGIPGTGYDVFARQYARILTRDGVDLEVHNYASAIQHFDVLRDATSPVQAALTTFGFTQPSDAATLYSLGGISDTAIFLFYKNAEPITRFVQFRGKRLSIGMPRTALRTLMLDVLKATGALDDSIHLSDLDYREAIDAMPRPCGHPRDRARAHPPPRPAPWRTARGASPGRTACCAWEPALGQRPGVTCCETSPAISRSSPSPRRPRPVTTPWRSRISRFWLIFHLPSSRATAMRKPTMPRSIASM